MLVFFLEIDGYGCTQRAIYRRMKLANLLKLAQIGFHTLYQGIHLLQGASVRQVGIGSEHNLLVAREIASLGHFLHKQAQRTSQGLVDNRLDLLLIRSRTQRAVVQVRPPALALQFLRQQENRQTKTQHQHQAHHPTKTAYRIFNHAAIETGEINRRTPSCMRKDPLPGLLRKYPVTDAVP